MRIGIVSDSHGKADRLAVAMKTFADHGCHVIVHCGDISNRSSVEALAHSPMDAYLVAGNMDRHYTDLPLHAHHAGIHFHPLFIEVPLGDGRHLVAAHGHQQELLAELIAGWQFPYLCHGHTHRRRDERDRTVRIICPGALWRPRKPSRPSVAVLDTDSDELAFIDLSNRPCPRL